MNVYETVIGLEVHAQLSTKTKLFCGSSAAFGGEPNARTDPYTLGLPGTLPVLNALAVRYAIRLGLALGCDIQERSIFARKNYFYPDLPKNYQISQFEAPICLGGGVPIREDGRARTIPLERIHLEEDAGKSMHLGETSQVDLNRSGVPLVEIVSKPAMSGPAQAGLYLGSLRQILRYLQICDGNMEEGSLRCDANISIRPHRALELGTRVELKNMNSIRGVVAALEHEYLRQAGLLDRGETVEQETRSWDPDAKRSVFMRGKEEAHDYRYFPEPDLLPLVLDPQWIRAERDVLPELPFARQERLARQLSLPDYDAGVLSSERELGDYFESVIENKGDAKAASNWIMSELLGQLNDRSLSITEFPVSPAELAGLLSLIGDGSISGKIAKEVFQEMIDSGRSAGEIVDAKGLRQISGDDELLGHVTATLEANPPQCQQYLDGKESVLSFFVGQIMKATHGQANPKRTNELLREALEAKRKA
jgi:aspartyl-tRNA(Asn)/glutamyl-tRNA(Gln) amidotransferase subunit B